MRPQSCTICSCTSQATALSVAVYKLIITVAFLILPIYGAVHYRDKPNEYIKGYVSKIGLNIALTLIASLFVLLLGLHLMLLYAVIKCWLSPIRWWTRLMPTMEILMIGGVCGFFSMTEAGAIVIVLMWTAQNFLWIHIIKDYGKNMEVRPIRLEETKEDSDEEKNEDESKSSSV